MFDSYWTGYYFGYVWLALIFAASVLFTILLLKKKLSTNHFLGCIIIFAFFTVILLSEFIIPYAKDYEYAKNETYIEVTAKVVEFTEKSGEVDSPSVHYYRPKFYIPSTDEYIILSINDVEIGKYYIIRYLPNTEICEIVYRFK